MASMPTPERELVRLVEGARANDAVAWSRLVKRFDRSLRAIGRSYGLSPFDAEDAVQTTWLRVWARLGSLRDPAAIAGWVTTTMRRECLRSLRAQAPPTDDLPVEDRIEHSSAESAVLAAERRMTLVQAIASLPERHARLMVLLAHGSGADYAEIADKLEMPVGSIGPIRARSLARLRRHAGLRALGPSTA